jgi:hypothetical protein
MIVVMVNSESTVPEVTANPIFEVTNPKVIKTSGEIIIRARSQIENLFALLAQIALMELAARAIKTALIIYNHIWNLLIKIYYTTKNLVRSKKWVKVKPPGLCLYKT